jgi:hypothetical protein
MTRSRALAAVSVSVILGVTLLSGPLVGVIDLTQPRVDTVGLGQGSATVDDVEAPSTARLERGFQSDSYYLEVPDARIHVASITGRPTVSYKLALPAMNYSRGTTHFLSADDTGWVAVSIEQDTFRDDQVTASSYAGNLSLVLRYNDTERVLYDRPVAVEVTE